MPWISQCENAVALAPLYDSTDDLDMVALHEATLHREGRLLELRFDLPRYPDRPAARWPAGATTLQVRLRLWDVRALRLDGWSATPTGTLTIASNGAGGATGSARTLRFVAPGVTLDAGFDVARIEGLSAYATEADAGEA